MRSRIPPTGTWAHVKAVIATRAGIMAIPALVIRAVIAAAGTKVIPGLAMGEATGAMAADCP